MSAIVATTALTVNERWIVSAIVAARTTTAASGPRLRGASASGSTTSASASTGVAKRALTAKQTARIPPAVAGVTR